MSWSVHDLCPSWVVVLICVVSLTAPFMVWSWYVRVSSGSWSLSSCALHASWSCSWLFHDMSHRVVYIVFLLLTFSLSWSIVVLIGLIVVHMSCSIISCPSLGRAHRFTMSSCLDDYGWMSACRASPKFKPSSMSSNNSLGAVSHTVIFYILNNI